MGNSVTRLDYHVRDKLYFGRNTTKCLEYFVTADPNKIPWPEVFFYLINIMYLLLVAYYLTVAYIEVAWQTSISALQDEFSVTGDNIQIYETSIAHHIIAVAALVLTAVGIKAAYSGHETLLYCYSFLMLVVIIFELFYAFRISVRSEDCVFNFEKLRDVLKIHVNNFYSDAPMKTYVDKFLDPKTGNFTGRQVYRRIYDSYFLINDIQTSLGCCGYDSFMDYLKPNSKAHGFHDPNDHTSSVQYKVPSSCCRATYIRNIHCASELWANNSDLLSKQIFTEGCTERIIRLCNEIVESSSRGAFFMCFSHVLLFIFSLPLVIIQVKILHFLSDAPFNFTEMDLDSNNVMMSNNSQEYKDISSSLYEHDFHRDSDLVLSSEMREFFNALKREHGMSADEDIHKTVLLMERKNAGPSGEGSVEKLPAFTMTREDKRKFKQHSGRFNYVLNKQLLNYAAVILNANPTNANANNTLQDMRKAELLANMNLFYNDVVTDEKDKLTRE